MGTMPMLRPWRFHRGKPGSERAIWRGAYRLRSDGHGRLLRAGGRVLTSYLLLGSALVTLFTRALSSPRIAPTLSPRWKARLALLLGVAGGSLSAAVAGQGFVEALTAGILVGAGSIGIYELDKGRARPLLAPSAPAKET